MNKPENTDQNSLEIDVKNSDRIEGSLIQCSKCLEWHGAVVVTHEKLITGINAKGKQCWKYRSTHGLPPGWQQMGLDLYCEKCLDTFERIDKHRDAWKNLQKQYLARIRGE